MARFRLAYVCKVWPQPALTTKSDRPQIGGRSGIGEKVIFSTNVVSQNFMPIYCLPATSTLRLRGWRFWHDSVEANACEKPVIAIDAMAFATRWSMVRRHFWRECRGKKITEANYGEGHDYEKSHRIVFPNRALLNIEPACRHRQYLLLLMKDSALRQRMGEAAANTCRFI